MWRGLIGGLGCADRVCCGEISVLPPGPAAELFGLIAQVDQSPVLNTIPIKVSMDQSNPEEFQENHKGASNSQRCHYPYKKDVCPGGPVDSESPRTKAVRRCVLMSLTCADARFA